MRITFLCAIVMIGILAVEVSGQDREWRIEGLESSVVAEIKGRAGTASVSRKAEKGLIVQIKGVFSPPAGASSLTLSQVKLAGTSADPGVNSSWTFEPIGIGLATATSCVYAFPDSIIKGKQVQSLRQGGELGLSREKEGDDLTVSIGPSTPLCLAFPVPAMPRGEMKLQLGESRLSVPAALPK
jgi:hypothetical protein